MPFDVIRSFDRPLQAGDVLRKLAGTMATTELDLQLFLLTALWAISTELPIFAIKFQTTHTMDTNTIQPHHIDGRVVDLHNPIPLFFTATLMLIPF